MKTIASVLLLCLFACSHTAGPPVPMQFMAVGDASPLPIVPCTIGKSIGKCVLDTGANTTLVAATEATKDFPLESKASTVTIHGARETEIVRAPLVSIGGSFRKEEISVTRTNDYHGYPDFQGVIGADMLVGRDFSFHVTEKNQPGSEIAPLAGVDFQALPKLMGPGVLFPESPFVELMVKLNEIPLRAMWDTHVASSRVSKRFVLAHPALFQVDKRYQEKDSAGFWGEARIYQLKGSLCLFKGFCKPLERVGEFDMPDTEGKGDAPFDLILGHDWIYSYQWFFKPSQKAFWMQAR